MRPRARRGPTPLPLPPAALPPSMPGAGAQHSAGRGAAAPSPRLRRGLLSGREASEGEAGPDAGGRALNGGP